MKEKANQRGKKSGKGEPLGKWNNATFHPSPSNCTKKGNYSSTEGQNNRKCKSHHLHCDYSFIKYQGKLYLAPLRKKVKPRTPSPPQDTYLITLISRVHTHTHSRKAGEREAITWACLRVSDNSVSIPYPQSPEEDGTSENKQWEERETQKSLNFQASTFYEMHDQDRKYLPAE